MTRTTRLVNKVYGVPSGHRPLTGAMPNRLDLAIRPQLIDLLAEQTDATPEALADQVLDLIDSELRLAGVHLDDIATT